MYKQILRIIKPQTKKKGLLIMSEYKLKTGKTGEAVIKGYKKIENAFVNGYKKIENAVVSKYKKIEDKFIEAYLDKGDEE